jgi:hypothetical protein
MKEQGQEYWNKDADKYRQLADLLRVIAEQHCDTPIDDLTHTRWAEIMSLMVEVDAYVDNTLAPDANVESEVVGELESFARFRGRYPHIAPEALGEMKWNQLEATAREIIDQSHALRDVGSYEDYVEHRSKEAIATARLFEVTATPEVRLNPAFHSRFMATLETLGVGACMLDSANDLGRDYIETKTALEPTLINRGKLFRDAFTRGLSQLDMLRHKSVRRELGRAAIQHAKRHADQRFSKKDR